MVLKESSDEDSDKSFKFQWVNDKWRFEKGFKICGRWMIWRDFIWGT